MLVNNSPQQATMKILRTPYGTKEVEFRDPMTARKLDLPYAAPSDQIVDLTEGEKLGLTARQWLIDMPKAALKGLQGSPDYSMSDFSLLTKVPYYLGGVFLTLSFLAGRDRIGTFQQGLGVLGYYLAFCGAQAAVNRLYKLRYGIDFGQMYQTPDGHYDKVYGSVSYPRIDLLRPKEFWIMRKKLGIPDDIASPTEAVKHQLPNILSAAWLDRMVLSNAFAAVLTGYLTRQAAVKGFPEAIKSLWKTSTGKGLTGLMFAVLALRAVFRQPLATSKGAQRLAMGLVVGSPLFTLWHCLQAKVPEQYETSGLPKPPPSHLKEASPAFSLFDREVEA